MRLRIPRSVRGRVLAATVILAAVGLLVANLATYGFLRSFLLRRVDEQLRSAVIPVAVQLRGAPTGAPDFGPAPPRGAQTPLGTYGAYLDSSGRVVRDEWFLFPGEQEPAAPTLLSGLPGSASGPVSGQRYLTLSASPGGVTYRAIAVPLADGAGTVVVAIPLTETTATLHRLMLVELVASGVVLVLIGACALWLVRLGLRPLDQMGATAGAIAAGDLSRRVEPAEQSTEVGRLGLALNAMLGQIEGAFGKQRASEERLRRFLADASHELRTPITSIRGYAELFRHGASEHPDDLAMVMARIESEAGRMGFLVEDLLLLARLDQGKPLARDPVDLASVSARAVQDARAADAHRSFELDEHGPVIVEGDEIRLKQVLDNLLANVRVHTPEGTSARVTVWSDGEATVDVSDDGPGVPAEIGSRVFERLYRADASRSRENGGVGLGLAIAEEIARAHGGALTLEPSERGATFRLTLPRVAEGVPAPASFHSQT